MQNNARTYPAEDGKTITLVPETRGISFMHLAQTTEEVADAYRVGLKWSSLRQLVSAIRNGKKYISNDSTLQVWSVEGEIHLLFRSGDFRIQSEVILGVEDSQQLIEFITETSKTKSSQ